MLNRDRASLLFATLLLALVLGGVGLYTWSNDPCHAGDTRYCDGAERHRMLNRDGAPLWWYAAAAVLILGVAALPLVGRGSDES